MRSAAALSSASRRAVGSALGDQLLLATCQLDLRLQLVLTDRTLALDRERSALVGRLVGVLLHLLTRRRPQRLLDLRLGTQRDHPHADDGDASVGRGARNRHGVMASRSAHLTQDNASHERVDGCAL
jgi:hypothetical protein